VIDPVALLEEIENLKIRGISIEGRLFISPSAHLVMPYHKVLERAREKSRGEGKIGATGRGIGPCYVDKVGRTGIRVVDLLDEKLFREKLSWNVREKNLILTKVYGSQGVDEKEIFGEYRELAGKITPFVTDTSVLLNQALRNGKSVLFEGAQGTLLDVDHGTYPFVTSSNTSAGNACAGSGVGPTRIDEVIGVAKAYTTRVGNGPLPTELKDEIGEKMRELGHEYGATTGRPRRCGWFDAVVARFSARINGLTSLAITRLDVLDSFPEIKICTAYRYNGRTIEEFPSDLRILSGCEPVYETWKGWMVPTSETLNFDQLPENAKRYLNRIAQLTDTEISLVSVGRRREQTIVL
ncbi:MAG TPA: adenylosuccinate synthase, partial [Candidatus Latescibacteria bacterium]|nr:adenylosuccinate synthase [Candidatus Latescibacterota bacterium]